MDKICKNCGAPLFDNARFCNKCGNTVPVAVDSQRVVQNNYVDFRGPVAENAPSSSNNNGKKCVTVFVVIAVVLQLVSAFMFAIMPAYNVSVDFSVREKSYETEVFGRLEAAGAESVIDQDLTALQLSDQKIQGLEFLQLEHEELSFYIVLGVSLLCVLGVVFLIAPMITKKTLGFAFGLPSVISQVALICSGAGLMLILSDRVKTAMERFLTDFAKKLVLDNNITLEGTANVSFSMWGFVIAGVCVLSVISTILAVIFGIKNSKKQAE